MELRELILESINTQDTASLFEILEQHHAIDIALEIEDFEDKDLKLLYQMIGPEQIASIVEEGDEELQKRILNLIESTQIAEIFSFMSTDDVADVLGYLPVDLRKELLKLMRSSNSKDVELLLGYGPYTAGSIMTTQYIALKRSLNIKETLQKIKAIGPKTEVIEILFVVDDNNELIGTADLRDVLNAPEDSKLNDIVDKNYISVTTETDQEDVALLVSKYDLKAIPVINRKKAIIGIITVDDIIDVIVEEHTEDFLMLSGVSKDERADSSLTMSIKRRLPWLYINLITAFLATFTIGLFEDVIVQVVALAAVMPIVTGMGGNAGTQTLSIVIRGIALGEVNLRDDWKLVFKEVALGVINGALTGVVTGVILYFKYGNIYLGLIIFAAMIGNLVIAGFFGFLIPLVLKKIKLDPAISSAIFLTTATDVCGFFIFLSLAKIFLPFLL